MKSIKLPTPHTILLIIAGLVAILTWFVPAGKFDTLQYQKDSNSFTYTHLEEVKTLPANQEILENLGVKIPLEKFTNGDIGKPINVPKTYTQLDPKPQGFLDFIKSPIKGIIQSSDIILFVLILGGLIGVMNFTGAFDAGISWLAEALKGKEYWLIIVVTTLIAIGGTTFGLAEEIIAFYPILIPIFLAAKYDAIVALASVYIGSSIGTMCSTVNPFSVIIASDAAGINWTTGFTGRLIMLILGLIICILYIFRYANRVQKDVTKSIVFDQKEMIENLFGNSTSNSHTLTGRLRIILTVFALCFVIMIYGVSRLGWWFEEMTVVFLIGSILIGFLAKMKEESFVTLFIKGANDLLGVAFIIGIARGVSVVMEQGLISDTILHYASGLTSGMSKGVFTNVLLFIYSGLSFFIPSSSGMAVLTMPIMSPLADTVGIGREVIVNAYQYGMGLFAFINPTGLILASLAIVKIGYDKWLKFVIPLVIILTVFTMIALTIQVYI
ncbi:putative ion transporter superfamily protein YfcC [Tenacibaculum adriaticum]|uniref:Putative ion transporter superfamily protein YfcC n=1 Tax=Tenacibaculum adriaticum TaxID=413713 RepID=A0A5S5DYQ9_9FLAO|nr:YfcC family protein [Tenacibaculum adriaticum]TYP99719.1 putative ion transporter superfamily protein YfcC [Tenacibaculum adriaticum]